MGVGGVVPLAELDETSGRRQATLRSIASPAMNDVDAGAGDLTNVVDKSGRSRVEDMSNPQGREEVALGSRTPGHYDSRVAPPGRLDRRHPDGTGPAMDQHPFAAPQLRERDQRIVGGQERDR